MTLDQLLAAVDELSPDEQDQVIDHLKAQKQPARPRTVEEWIAELEDIARDIRGDSTPEEMQEIFDAMDGKTKPVSKGQ